MDAPMIDNKRHYKSNIIWTVSAIALGTCSYAYNGAIIGSTLGQPSFYVYMGLDEADTDLNAVIGTITGLFYVGGFVGVILNSYLADKIGRKMTSLSAGIILVVSAGCLAGSINVAMFETFRFFAGLGSHMFYLSIPLWVTELVPPKNRGVLVGIVGLNGAIGYLISAWGMAIGVAGFCLVDILWLELAPTAQAAIGWKYYLVFISLSVFGAMFMYTTFPNTLGLPLEEIAKLFGDEDLVAVYQENIHLDHNTHEIVNVSKEGQDKLVVERREAFERRASS
ncbi:hypothetical protein MBLNU459_g7058t2 [Dothideomycetes sp. NU459]